MVTLDLKCEIYNYGMMYSVWRRTYFTKKREKCTKLRNSIVVGRRRNGLNLKRKYT
jgi:hypothetical protein